jgi:VIT1/CCC1 family predicted Fe2+/Mn2+ transporter
MTALSNSNHKDLIKYINRSLEEEEDFHFLRFESLQRTNIVALQIELVRFKKQIRKDNDISKEDLKILKETLKDYGERNPKECLHITDQRLATAIRDYRFLRTKKSLARKDMNRRRLLLQRFFQSEVGHGDLFYSHYSYFEEADVKIDALRASLMKTLPAWLTYSQNEREERKNEYGEGRPPKEVSAFVDRLVRFLISIVGGLFLVVPMLIMALNPSEKKSLITVSASVFLFVMALSFGVNVTNVESLVPTATYAAVLVVFVGTSSGGNDGTRLEATRH